MNVKRLATIISLTILNVWAIQLLVMELQWHWIEWGIENYGSNGLIHGFLGGLCEVADNLLFAGEYIQAITRLASNHPMQFLFVGLFGLVLDIANKE